MSDSINITENKNPIKQHSTQSLLHTLSCKQCKKVLTGAKTCPKCQITICSACALIPICEGCFLTTIQEYKLDWQEMARNRPVDQLVHFSINDLLTISSNPDIATTLNPKKGEEQQIDEERIQCVNRSMYKKAKSTLKKLKSVDSTTKKLYIPGIITFKPDTMITLTLIEIASFEFNLRLFMDYDNNHGVRICMLVSQDDSHREEIKNRMKLERSVRDTLEIYFTGTGMTGDISTLKLDDSYEEDESQNDVIEPTLEQKYLNSELEKEFIQSDDDAALNKSIEIEDNRPEHEKKLKDRKSQKTEEIDKQYHYSRSLTIKKSVNLQLSVEMGYMNTPTLSNPIGEMVKENSKKYEIQIPELTAENINQKMVIAVLSKNMFTTTKIKNIFESFFFKSKPDDVHNFYLKPKLEVTYTPSEYKKKRAISKMIQRIQKLQTQNNEDFRQIDKILNENKAAALNVAKKQKEYEAMEIEVSKKLTPKGKDITISKRLNEFVFLVIIGVWLAWVSFFNPKLLA